MNRLRLFSVTTIGILLAACSQDEGLSTITYDQVKAHEQMPVTFATYMGEQATTRAMMNDTELQTTGFGVFATYSNNGFYAATTGPNFMYNQHVTYAAGPPAAWSYTPLKYWPNEYGANATSTGTDKLSFFAYAPYKATSTGGVLITPQVSGITSITANNATTDPKVTYTTGTTVSEDDLVWGVTDATSGFTYTPIGAAEATVLVAGKPFLDMVKPSTATAVDFHLRHALAGLKLTVIGAFDQTSGGGTKDAATYITIDRVTVTATLPPSGTLNLNNTTASTPLWESLAAGTSKTFTVTGDALADDLNYNEGGAGQGWQQAGVTASSKDVIKNMSSDFFRFIPPTAATNFTVNVVYHVCTVDAALVGGKSNVENNISQTISITPTHGNIYTINMVLGMTSVKLSASVDAWGDGGTSAVNLPANSN